MSGREGPGAQSPFNSFGPGTDFSELTFSIIKGGMAPAKCREQER